METLILTHELRILSKKTAKAKQNRINRHIRAFKEFGSRCPICDCQMNWSRALAGNKISAAQKNQLASVEHIIPESFGGDRSPENVVIVCYQCNSTRDTKNFAEFVMSHSTCKNKEVLLKKYFCAVDLYLARNKNHVLKGMGKLK